jgi:hypothetical protein
LLLLSRKLDSLRRFTVPLIPNTQTAFNEVVEGRRKTLQIPGPDWTFQDYEELRRAPEAERPAADAPLMILNGKTQMTKTALT